MMKSRFWFFFVMMLSVALTSCLKDDDSTLILFGEEKHIKTFKTVFGVGANDTLVKDGDLILIHDLGIVPANIDSTNNLFSPPDIRGKFSFDSVTMKYPYMAQVADTISFRFFDQHHMTVCCECKFPGLQKATVNEVYVKGNGSNFWAYFEIKQTTAPSMASYMAKIEVRQGVLVKGKMSGGALNSAEMTLFNKEVKVLNPSEVTDPSIIAVIEGRKDNIITYVLGNRK